MWAATTDDGPYNGWLERPALRSLVPRPLAGLTVLDAGCGAGGQSRWLLSEGAEVIGVDLSAAMVAEAAAGCAGRGRFFQADLAEPLELPDASVDGITSSLVLHYLRDWQVPLRSFARILRPGGWVVLSVDHPFAPAMDTQQGSYFDAELVSDTWIKSDVEVTQYFWRRPLAAVMAEFSAAGFVIDAITESRPSAEALQRFPAELGPLTDVPSFIIYRLRSM
ncbi:class I SAM-dependent methyltransferase [Nocardia coffeae]|uniref:class I SAM-dependent methyltransferase n=1 Tax=Nocardia coffeae TaxID=2873381 RepID=UPI0027E15131|nr:class I SAM-dependent methyltransferase [Nocardia coffeae]